MHDIFEQIDALPLNHSKICNLGRFTRAFLEENEVITNKLIPYLKKCFYDSLFCSKLFNIYIHDLEIEKRILEEKKEEEINSPNASLFYNLQIAPIIKKLNIENFEQLIKFIDEEFQEYTGILYVLDNSYRNIHGVSGEHYIKNNYKYYYIGNILYGEYCKKKARIEFVNQDFVSHVISEYQKVGVDIQKEDLQFEKYKLISLNNHFRMNNNKDSQTIVDSRIEKHFWIEVPRKLLFSIEQLINEKLISNIAFRIDHITEFIPVMEEMEFGSSLKINVINLPELSKFYSVEQYDDNLWISHDKSKQSLTFEEHLNDFELVNDDVITQVVHLEYKMLNGRCFINHIDHEFIVYTFEQYSERIDNPNIKGYKKIKTFKIDKAIIPFNYKYNGEYFLLQVLDAYFKNKELLNEYFAQI